MKNKIVVITGANSGIGKATAEAIAAMGATTVMICRSADKGEQARQDIVRKTQNNQVFLELCDLSSQADIHRFGLVFRQKYPSIDVLINNAGAIFGKRELTHEGVERTFATNHIGYFLLTHYLLDAVKNSEMRRIVNVSSLAHGFVLGGVPWDDLMLEKRRYRQFDAYGISKLFNVFFTRHLSKILAEEQSGVTVNCLHPGTIGSNFGSSGSKFFSWLARLARPLLGSTDSGAKTSVYLATSPDVKHISGEYFSKCKVKRTTRLGQDLQAAKRAWDISMQMTNIKNYGKIEEPKP